MTKEPASKEAERKYALELLWWRLTNNGTNLTASPRLLMGREPGIQDNTQEDAIYKEHETEKSLYLSQRRV